MAEETGIQEGAAGADVTTNQAEKVFTQADLDAIVKDRLSRERKKFADYDKYKAAYEAQAAAEEANKSDLQKALDKIAELEAEKATREAADAHAALVKQVLADNEIDAKYAPLLTASDEDGLKAQAQLIAETFPAFQPSHNERRKPASTDAPKTNGELFAELLEQNGIQF